MVGLLQTLQIRGGCKVTSLRVGSKDPSAKRGRFINVEEAAHGTRGS